MGLFIENINLTFKRFKTIKH